MRVCRMLTNNQFKKELIRAETTTEQEIKIEELTRERRLTYLQAKEIVLSKEIKGQTTL